MNENYSIVVFPFLKTLRSVKLGGLTFRSTKEIDTLTAEQANSVKEIANMLFLKDDLRIDVASYAIVPFIDIKNNPAVNVDHLINIQSVVAYIYGYPHEIFGDPFLTTEHASIVIFSPGRVIASLVRPDHNVISTGDRNGLSVDKWGQVSGYSGLYNFRHHFWVSSGSRVYGPKPQLTLNISQDLSNDIERASRHRQHYKVLFELLNKPERTIASRVFIALRWYNRANCEATDDNASLVSLSIAFESLLSLPKNNKTERLVDAIAMILGRLPRLDIWAQQFYDARSEIVHEGQTHQLHFVASDSRKKSNGEMHQSLLSYGRQVFRLCLGTLLLGSDIAEKAGLEEKLVTNHERFKTMNKTLANDNIDPCERFNQIQPLVRTVSHYRSLYESNLKIQTLIGTVRLVAKTLLDCDISLPYGIHEKLKGLISANRTENHLDELEAIRGLEEALEVDAKKDESQHIAITREIVDIVWEYVFMYYYWVRDQHS